MLTSKMTARRLKHRFALTPELIGRQLLLIDINTIAFPGGILIVVTKLVDKISKA